MKINETTALATSKVTLVPYSSHHVPTYHTWMQDEELQAATASEPLTLPEEYDMQRSWRLDRDKLTFIVCLPIRNVTPEAWSELEAGVVDAPERMIGDINIFLLEPEDDGEDHEDLRKNCEGSQEVVGEIELMIASKNLQGQGYGRAALVAFLSYVLTSWDQIASEYSKHAAEAPELRYLRVKINQSNNRSIALFRSIGFQATKEGANYFGEIEMRWQPDQHLLSTMKGWEEMKILQYIDSSVQGRP